MRNGAAMSYLEALQITPIGLAIASVFWIVGYKFVLRPLWQACEAKPWRRAPIAVLALAFLILPYADELWIAWRFSNLCEDAGVHINRKVEVEGFVDATTRESLAYAEEFVITDPGPIRDFDRAGYRFTESLFSNGKVRHLERVPGGIRVTILDRPMARYVYKFANPKREVAIGLKLEKRETIIVDSKTEEVIGRETSFNRYPGWIEGLWVRFLGSGQTICNRPLNDIEKTTLTGAPYYYVLIPATKQ